jgi:hypothetical protein
MNIFLPTLAHGMVNWPTSGFLTFFEKKFFVRVFGFDFSDILSQFWAGKKLWYP